MSAPHFIALSPTQFILLAPQRQHKRIFIEFDVRIRNHLALRFRPFEHHPLAQSQRQQRLLFDHRCLLTLPHRQITTAAIEYLARLYVALGRRHHIRRRHAPSPAHAAALA